MIRTATPATEFASRVFLFTRSSITTTAFKINEPRSTKFQNDKK